MTRAFLLLNAVAFGVFGAFALLDPIALVGGFGLEAGGRHGAYELRGIYGGVSLAAALFCALGVLRERLARPALMFILTYTGGYVFARFAAMVFDGPPEPYYWSFIAFEAAMAGGAAALLRSGRPFSRG